MTNDYPPPAFVVRDATLADVAAMNRVYDKADHARRIRAADGKRARYFVVEAGGEVAGFGRLVFVQPDGSRKLAFLPWIANLNVRGDMQGRGCGSALIEHMVEIARAAGYRAAYIGVHPQNPRAFALYKRMGFEPVEHQPGDEPGGGPDSDAGRRCVIYMHRPLG